MPTFPSSRQVPSASDGHPETVTPDTLTAIQEAVIFRGLNEEEGAAVAECASLKEFSAGSELLQAGQTSPGLYVIRSGAVSVVLQDADGSDREVGRIGKGECVGEMALLTGELCTSTVRALEDTVGWLIEPQDFLAITERSPLVWRNFGRILSQRLARTSRNLAVRSLANTTALLVDGDDELSAAIAWAAAASIIHQTGEKTLLVDGLRDPANFVQRMSGAKESPGFAAILDDKKLLGEHAAPIADGTPRICLLSEAGGVGLGPGAALEVLETLRPLYQRIIILCSTKRGADRADVVRLAGTVVAVCTGESMASTPEWLMDVAQSLPAGARFKPAVLTGALSDRKVIQVIENEVGATVRRLPISARDTPALSEGYPVVDQRSRTAIGRLARQIAGKEVGLALGAGAAKGFAHIGALSVLDEEGIPVDMLAGTSIGAIVGAGFSGEVPLSEIQGLLHGADRKLTRWTLPIRSIWSDAGLVQLLRTPGPHTRFRDLPIPFAAVATDIASGREVVLRSGLVWKAALASATVPGIFPPAVNRGRTLVDGGLVNPVPGQTVRDLGADIVIAVDLMSPSARSAATQDKQSRTSDGRKVRIPNLVEILWRSNEIMQEEVTLRSAATADVTIEPKLGRVRWSDFSKRGKEYREAGEVATRERVSDIRALLAPSLAASAGSE